MLFAVGANVLKEKVAENNVLTPSSLARAIASLIACS